MQPINLPVRGSRYSFAIERGIIVIFHGIAGSGGTEVFDAAPGSKNWKNCWPQEETTADSAENTFCPTTA